MRHRRAAAVSGPCLAAAPPPPPRPLERLAGPARHTGDRTIRGGERGRRGEAGEARTEWRARPPRRAQCVRMVGAERRLQSVQQDLPQHVAAPVGARDVVLGDRIALHAPALPAAASRPSHLLRPPLVARRAAAASPLLEGGCLAAADRGAPLHRTRDEHARACVRHGRLCQHHQDRRAALHLRLFLPALQANLLGSHLRLAAARRVRRRTLLHLRRRLLGLHARRRSHLERRLRRVLDPRKARPRGDRPPLPARHVCPPHGRRLPRPLPRRRSLRAHRSRGQQTR
mmetsp:Transcript_25522/g.82260  ORF Transcript_25522/g.82260 Transcript_25522/m.82260 type:complete len:286 (-) Transcript_25522:328-1185(-)